MSDPTRDAPKSTAPAGVDSVSDMHRALMTQMNDPVMLTADCATDNGRPEAIAICSFTMSTPLTISVTGCSTCMRVFISRK